MKKLCVALFLLGLFLAALRPGNAEDFYWIGPTDPVHLDVRSDDPYYLLHLIHYQLYRQRHPAHPVQIIVIPGGHSRRVVRHHRNIDAQVNRKAVTGGR